jgi:hypothetical protein
MFCFNSGYLQVVGEMIILSQSLGAGDNKNWTESVAVSFQLLLARSLSTLYLKMPFIIHIKLTSPNTKKSFKAIWGNISLHYETHK